MRVLYEAYKHDPHDPMAGSGSDYNFLRAIEHSVEEVKIVGPLNSDSRIHLAERVIKRIHSKITDKKYSKFPITSVYKTSRLLTEAVREWKPDVVFTIFPASLVNYKGKAPVVYRVDTSIRSIQEYHPIYDALSYRMMRWVEARAFEKVSRFITHSTWCKDVLVRNYGVDAEKIMVFPNPAALPSEVIPTTLDSRSFKPLEPRLRLLLVGRDYERKGIDIAIATVDQLNAEGIPTTLTIGGLEGRDTAHVHFAGYFRKSDPEELKQYVGLYQQTHLLLHPARFDASPIVTSEAAAFGVPTITNAAGGLATSVKDGVSGIVLPMHSPPEAYVEVIRKLVAHPEQYRQLCQSTRRRYEEELNWQGAGKQVANILHAAVLNAL